MNLPSLSKTILFGTSAEVRNLIAQGADVNEKDAYGLTPLIEATIKNYIDIAKLLLEKGARVDQEDVSGQTALQWAINRNNEELCTLFLAHKADPNHYSADGQPILVNPLLRDQTNLQNLLLKNGANMDFAHDFIRAKLFAHRFELTGKADIINAEGHFIELDLEGFFLEFTVGIIQKSLARFLESVLGKKYAKYSVYFNKILRTLKYGSELIQYKYTTTGYKQNEGRVRELLNYELAVIPVTYEGHAITFIKYKDLFAKCDRGVKHIVDTVTVYQVGNPYALNPDFLIDLMYKSKTNEYINLEVKKILNLFPFTTLPPRYQLSGNCSFANVEASIPAMLLMLVFPGDIFKRAEIAELKKEIMQFYDAWVNWDKDRMLDEYIALFDQLNTPRKVSIASLLATYLFQRCDPSVRHDIDRAKKILKILVLPVYQYILKNYIKIYGTKMAGKRGENFLKVLTLAGFNFKTFGLKD